MQEKTTSRESFIYCAADVTEMQSLLLLLYPL